MGHSVGSSHAQHMQAELARIKASLSNERPKRQKQAPERHKVCTRTCAHVRLLEQEAARLVGVETLQPQAGARLLRNQLQHGRPHRKLQKEVGVVDL